MNQQNTNRLTTVLKLLQKMSIALVFFLVPTNLFLTLCENCGYAYGLLSDYLIPKLYLQDIPVSGAVFLGAALGAFPVKKLRILQTLKSPTSLILLILWFVLLLTQILSTNPGLGAIHWLRMSIYLLFGYMLWTNFITFKPIMLRASQVGLLFQSFVAAIQWHTQQSLAGYWLLGEPALSAYSGITKTVKDGAQVILPYGTTPHPNILGGYASIVVLLSVYSILHSARTSFHSNHLLTRYFSISTILAGLYVIFLTQSAPAALALILAGLVGGLAWNIPQKWLQKITISKHFFLLFFLILWSTIALLTWYIGNDQITNPSLFRRAYLLESSQKMISENLLVGVGLGQFTSAASQEIRPFETSRFNQPVHHSLFLWISETGILGLFLFVLCFLHLLGYFSQINQEKSSLTNLFLHTIILTPLLVWDHYLVSLPQGQLLILLWVLSALNKPTN